MNDIEREDGTDRTELLQRVELVEQMIAEGRMSVERRGWIFVAWGVCYVAAMLWSGIGPHPHLAWPVCLAVTILTVGSLQVRQEAKQRARGVRGLRSRTLQGVWVSFSGGILFFVAAAGAAHKLNSAAFLPAICFFLGTVNMTSAAILRWKMQGLAGAIWWAAGAACFFLSGDGQGIAFLTATVLSQICFGLYMMVLERRRDAGMTAHHA